MPARRVRHLSARTRKGLRSTAVAVTAVAALTASQGPGVLRTDRAGTAADRGPAPEAAVPHAEPAPPGDGSYHTELPPLSAPETPPGAEAVLRVRAESGIPATVLRAYRAAEASVARSDPGCRLPWELLAAIGKVESGHARGGAVDRDGTTLRRITGPALDGRNFALVRDSDGGVHDGDAVYDRAVGPMQFLPSTWARWGADGNGDGRADPDNVFDAALAAGHYLCAGGRDLARDADLDRAILSYNRSDSYLTLVRRWLDFYRRGVHTVPDGEGVVPVSPGAGGDTPATKPVDGGPGGGIVVGPDPASPTPGGPGPSSSASPSPSASGGPDPSASGTPGTGPDSPSGTPDPSGSPTGADPSPGPEPGESPDPVPSGSPSPTPCATASDTASPGTAAPDTAAEPSAAPDPGDPTCPTGDSSGPTS